MKNLHFLTHQDLFDRAVDHLFDQGHAALLPRGGGAYRGYRGGCPVGSLIAPRDYLTAMEGVPVRYIGFPPNRVPAYMDAGVAALKRALLRSRVNVFECWDSRERVEAFRGDGVGEEQLAMIVEAHVAEYEVNEIRSVTGSQ